MLGNSSTEATGEYEAAYRVRGEREQGARFTMFRGFVLRAAGDDSKSVKKVCEIGVGRTERTLSIGIAEAF